jgi:glycosyltransferase involved in cell wall biosynthesis
MDVRRASSTCHVSRLSRLAMSSTVIVIPCYNEGQRLAVDRFLAFLERHPSICLLFVNDGSRDNTREVLNQLKDRAGANVTIHELSRNQGKAEAVRQGCLAGFAQGAAMVGYWDADLATPLETIPDFIDVLTKNPFIELVCGARVQLLGRSIRRSWLRHYLGRVFATAASWTLSLPIYDTQCGAKLFRASPRLRTAFCEPFLTRWLLDVEILARMIAVGRAQALPDVAEVVHELPLPQWHDVSGSKVKPLDLFKALLELRAIYRHYLRPGVDWPRTESALAPAHLDPSRRAA